MNCSFRDLEIGGRTEGMGRQAAMPLRRPILGRPMLVAAKVAVQALLQLGNVPVLKDHHRRAKFPVHQVCRT